MKPAFSSLLVLAGTVCVSHGAVIKAFWSAQSTQDAINNPSTFDPNLTASTFPIAPSVSLAGPHVTAGGTSGGMPGGAPTFTDFQGNTWTGVASATGAGNAFGWNGTPATGTNALTLSLNLTNIQDLSIRMDVRSAEASTATPRAASFSAIEYSVAGGAFTAVPGASLGSFTSNSYVAMNFDLTALSAIEGQSNVQIRFTVPNTGSTTSFRFDNIQLTADYIPEPSSMASLIAAAGLFSLRRKRA